MQALLLIAFLLPSIATAMTFQPRSFSELTGWQSQNHRAALSALQASCKAGVRPKAHHTAEIQKADWQGLCRKASQTDPEQARTFFEANTRPFHVFADEPLVTGYYIPLLRGSRTRSGNYQWPVYSVPEDFTKPYLTRAEIEAGALTGQGRELLWLDDPVMRFFLHIQGSGQVQLPDGTRVTLQFAAKNERPYTAIGKVLLNQGKLKPGEVSLETIRDYLRAHPEQQREIFDHNESYVFFSLKENAPMPKGAQGVPLTPEHSLAIDPRFWPYGVPIYVEVQGEAPFSRLAITQDTGSAIKGALRSDWFAGLGDAAEVRAGSLAAPASFTVLLP